MGNYNPFRPAPTLGMRTGAVFVAKPLHDPSGEFAIVLYDPTIDEKLATKPGSSEDFEQDEEGKENPKLDVPIMHRSLADILGLKKQVSEHPKIPVVIDPRLAKVLRPHQVEGVKVCGIMLFSLARELTSGNSSFFIDVQQDSWTRTRAAVSWPMRWD